MMKVKLSKYDRQNFSYMIKNGKIKTAYEVAKHYKNVLNDGHYKDSLDKLTKLGYFIFENDVWMPNAITQKQLETPVLGEILKTQSELIVDFFRPDKKQTQDEKFIALIELLIEEGHAKKIEEMGSSHLQEKVHSIPNIIVANAENQSKPFSEKEQELLGQALKKKPIK